ncbi:MAG: hypothetical protein Q8L34_05820 [Candidatus Woesearchaeota archaeon]|nr:hypothetical protein [Candidatus Woesearchaeota archaeon]
MGKDYVALLDRIESERERIKNEKHAFRVGYHEIKKNKDNKDANYTLNRAAFELSNSAGYRDSAKKEYVRGSAVKIAHDAMAAALKTHNLHAALEAAEVYSMAGLGNNESVLRRLVHVAEVCSKDRKSDYLTTIKKVKDFVTSHQDKKSKGGLEERVSDNRLVAIVTGLILLGSFLSSQASMTGFAVRETSSAASVGWTSIVFFAFIIIAVAYFFKKK